MTITNEDLWPSDLGTEPPDQAPLLILSEQAEKLPEKTDGYVEAMVLSEPNDDGKSMNIRFILVAPQIGGYEYLLLRVIQPIDDLYPTVLEFEGNRWVANQETAFKGYLKMLFQSARTRKIIANLIAQSKKD